MARTFLHTLIRDLRPPACNRRDLSREHQYTEPDYYGDSVVHSLSDIVAMMRLLDARRLRANLTLSITMLIPPVEAVKHWQMGF